MPRGAKRQKLDPVKFAAFCLENGLVARGGQTLHVRLATALVSGSENGNSSNDPINDDNARKIATKLLDAEDDGFNSTRRSKILDALARFLHKPGLRAADIGFTGSESFTATASREIAKQIVNGAVDAARHHLVEKMTTIQRQLRTIVEELHHRFIAANLDVEGFDRDAAAIVRRVMPEDFFTRHPGGVNILREGFECVSQVIQNRAKATLVDQRTRYAPLIARKDYADSMNAGLQQYGISSMSRPIDRHSQGIIVPWASIPKDSAHVFSGQRRRSPGDDLPIGMINCVIDFENSSIKTVLCDVRREQLCAANEPDPRLDRQSKRRFGRFRVTLADKIGNVISDTEEVSESVNVKSIHPWLNTLGIGDLRSSIGFRPQGFVSREDGLFMLPARFIDGYCVAASYNPDTIFLAASLEVDE